jgi:hypothetical protein
VYHSTKLFVIEQWAILVEFCLKVTHVKLPTDALEVEGLHPGVTLEGPENAIKSLEWLGTNNQKHLHQ